MEDHVTTSERIDDLPLLVYWLKQMRVDVIVDEALGPPHGNWSGLSYGELAVVFLTHILMSCTHFLSPVQDWIAQHQASLSHALGKPVREQDGTDDRLAVLLGRLGREKSSAGEQQEKSSAGEQQEKSSAGEQQEKSSAGEQQEKSSAGEQQEKSSAGEQQEKSSAGEQQEKSSAGEQQEKSSAGEQQEKSSAGEQQEKSSAGEQQEKSSAGEQIECELGRHMIRAYALPTETGRIDMTSVSVHHQPKGDSGLLRFGHSKDHRPDLRQFKEALGTLDPCGIPLVTATLSGEQADDPNYLPVWERMVTILGRTDFLVVGDCKLASLSNRAHIQRRGGFYLSPLPLTGNTPALLQEWVLNPPVAPTPIHLPGQTRGRDPLCGQTRGRDPLCGQSPSDAAVGQGFELERTSSWTDPDTKTTYSWTERHLLVQSQVYAQSLRKGLQVRLAKAQAALAALNSKSYTTQTQLDHHAQAVLKRYRVQEYLHLQYCEHIDCQTHYVGRGRPGPKRDTQITKTCTWTVEAHCRTEAIEEFNTLAGWRIYVTNTAPERLSVTDAVQSYRQEWQPEHGFHRLKGGSLAITPLYLRDDDRLRGLLLLLGIALRVLTLTEFVVRRDLAATGDTLKGLYDGNPKRATDQPTSERLFKAFHKITLYRHQTPERVWYEVTPLSLLHRRILRAMGIPETIYNTPPAPLIRSG